MKHWDEVNIGEFTGPLDLLLTMIKDKKINIMDVNLIDLANQYLEYVNSQQALDIEIASEYLTMAAQLIEMKSNLLIPKDEDQTLIEDNTYEEFLEQLVRYEQIKSVTEFFSKKQDEYLKTFSKSKTKTNFAYELAKSNEDELMVDPLKIGLEDFAAIFKKIMLEAEMRKYDSFIDFEEDYFNTITTNVLSPQDIANMILTKMKTNKIKEWKLEELLDQDLLSLKNLISTFLAVLDLVRHSIAKIQQADKTLLIQFSKEALENEKIIEEWEVKDYE